MRIIKKSNLATSVYLLHHMQVLKLDKSDAIIPFFDPRPLTFDPYPRHHPVSSWIQTGCPRGLTRSWTCFRGVGCLPWTIWLAVGFLLDSRLCFPPLSLALPFPVHSLVHSFGFGSFVLCIIVSPFSEMELIYINIYKYFLYVCKYVLYIFFLLPVIFHWFWLQNVHVTFSTVR